MGNRPFFLDRNSLCARLADRGLMSPNKVFPMDVLSLDRGSVAGMSTLIHVALMTLRHLRTTAAR